MVLISNIANANSTAALSYNDPSLTNFRRIDRRQSELIYCTERITDKVFLVVEVVLFQDMTQEQRQRYDWLFDYIERDSPYRNKITSNAAQVDGGMKAAGYRAAYEPDYLYGTNATCRLVHLKRHPEQLAVYKARLDQAVKLHRRLSETLYYTPYHLVR